MDEPLANCPASSFPNFEDLVSSRKMILGWGSRGSLPINSIGANRNLWQALRVSLYFKSLKFWAGHGLDLGPQTKYLGAPHQKTSEGWGLPVDLTRVPGNMILRLLRYSLLTP